MTFSRVPVIDLEKADTPAERPLAQEIQQICHDVGFFYLKNHGVERRCNEYLTAAKRFFDLPEERKRAIHKQYSPHFRGWEQLGSELTNNKVDFREQLDLGTERETLAKPDPYYQRLIGPNQWPLESELPGFRAMISEFMDNMEHVSRRILRLISTSLGLDPAHVEKVFGDSPMPYCKLIRYPVTPEFESGVGPHKDAGFLSLLLQDEVGGLQAQNSLGEWVDIEPIPETLVVNLGEMLQIMTQNYLVATPHRVVVREAITDRYSLAYFYNPDLDTRLEVLPIPTKLAEQAKNSIYHINAGLMPNQHQLASGERASAKTMVGSVYGHKYWDRWVRSYPELVKKHHPDVKR